MSTERRLQSSATSVAAGTRILIAGASSDIGKSLIRLLASADTVIGAHYHRNRQALEESLWEGRGGRPSVTLYEGDLASQAACHQLVDDFVATAGGIDALVQLTGDVADPRSWEGLTERAWLADLNVNLSGPFFLAQRAMKHMKRRGGRIVFTSTASARHGGGATSIAYGVAKAGIECLTKGLAREGAPYNVLVNAVAPGLIDTQFHTKRMKRNAGALRERTNKVPLKRAGKPEDVASMIAYLLSPAGNFITGECICISGGDWL